MVSGPKGHHSHPASTICPKQEFSAPHPGRRPDSQPKLFSLWSGVQDRRRRPANPAPAGRPWRRSRSRTPSGKGSAASIPISEEIFWTDGTTARLRQGGGDTVLTPTPRTRLIDIQCDGLLDRPFVGGQLVADPRLRANFGPRVMSSTLAVAWVAAGRRAAYVTDGYLEGSVHFTAGIALCQAAGCVVTDLNGDPIHTGRGMIAAADEATHRQLLDLVRPHLEAAGGR